MKIFPVHILAILFIWIGAALPLQADSPTAIAELQTQLQKACETHDLNAVKRCYDFDGAPPTLVDEEMNVWQEYFNLNDKTTQWIFEKVAYMSLDQIKADPTINQRGIQSMTEPHNMNGTVYQPNLKIVGFITASFKQGSGGTGSMLPVGIAADGTAKLVTSVPAK